MDYINDVEAELNEWHTKMMKSPHLFNKMSKGVQNKINSYIPEKIHKAITLVIREMIKAVLLGSKFTTQQPLQNIGLQERDKKANTKILNYTYAAAAEGGITGAAGFVAAMADFPLFLTIKIKMLYEIAAIYGFNLDELKERIFLLHIFELAFSSRQHRKQIYLKIKNWNRYSNTISDNVNDFDWRSFQQEYRDYLDLAKIAQLLPVIGAPVGFFTNRNLTSKLGKTAMNAYRMRILN